MSDKIELKAYGKINLGLDVIRKRPDGYHDLDMIMQTVNVYDDIIITKTKKNGEIKVTTDKEVLSNEKGNLAYMAASMLFDELESMMELKLELTKEFLLPEEWQDGAQTVQLPLRELMRCLSSI